MTTSPLENALMGLLDQAPSSGYDLRMAFSSTPLRQFSSSPGSIYPALRRLADRGWIDADQPGGSRGRQAFRLNEQGRKAFITWLKGPVTQEDVIWGTDLLLLRFAFMGQALPPSDVQAFLDDLLRELGIHLASLEGFHGEHGKSMPLTGSLAFQHGVEQVRALQVWAREAQSTITRAKTWP